MRRLPAALAAAALLAAAVLLPSFGGAAPTHRFEAGRGPVWTSPPASASFWLICAAAPDGRERC